MIARIAIVLILMLSAMQVMPMESPLIERASAGSSWVQTTESDFDQGTFDNTTRFGIGSDSELRLESGDWINRNPPGTPAARQYHAMTSMYGTDKVLLFGGYVGWRDPFNDTYLFDFSTNTWEEKIQDIKPTSRERHSMACVHGTDKVVLYGGRDKSNNYLGDTWIYDLSDNKWTQKYPITNPGLRMAHIMTPIYGTDKVLLAEAYTGVGVGNRQSCISRWCFKRRHTLDLL
jgi:hypothetical protein